MALGDPTASPRAAHTRSSSVPQLFMLPAPEVAGRVNMYSMNSPAWTLFFELSVNIVYILAFRWMRDTRVLIGVVVVCAVLLAFAVFSYGRIDQGSHWDDWWVGVARAGFGFFAGVLAYRLSARPTAAGRRAAGRFMLVLAIPMPASPRRPRSCAPSST